MAAYFSQAVICCLAMVAFQCGEAKRIYCHADATSIATVKLDFPPISSNINLCFYVRDDEKWSTELRTCNFRIQFPRLMLQSVQLALEPFVVDEIRDRGELTGIESRARNLTKMLKVKMEGKQKPDTWVGWNESMHFQLFSLQNSIDYLDIRLVLDNQEKIDISSYFYLRITYANKNLCSRGLAKVNSMCLTVRNTSKMAQAVTFSSLSAVTQFYEAYESLAADGAMGDERHNTSKPLRLSMSHCNCSNGEQQLIHWVGCKNGTCGCNRWTVPGDRLLPGTGDCLSMWLEYRTGDVFFRPVSCAGVMPTLLGFAGEPREEQGVDTFKAEPDQQHVTDFDEAPVNNEAAAAAGVSSCRAEDLQRDCGCCKITESEAGHRNVSLVFFLIFIIGIIFLIIVRILVWWFKPAPSQDGSELDSSASSAGYNPEAKSFLPV